MHCKDVSIKDVDTALTSEEISLLLKGKRVYVRTEYLVLKNKDQYAVVQLFKGRRIGIFEWIEDLRIISLPKDTVFVRDHSVDVLNTPAMAAVQKQHPGKTVVIEGMFSHVNFVSGLKHSVLRVIDNTPPTPSKLSVLVRIALASGYIDHPIVPEVIDIDMEDRVKDVKTDAVMFPCRVSGLTANMPVYFLDEVPVVKHNVTLIGCGLSQRIHSSVYVEDVPFINVCPIDETPLDGINTILRCCKIKEGHVRDYNIVIVPWGATVPEIVDAINDLYSE